MGNFDSEVAADLSAGPSRHNYRPKRSTTAALGRQQQMPDGSWTLLPPTTVDDDNDASDRSTSTSSSSLRPPAEADPNAGHYISSIADTHTTKISDGFVILACDGVWDEITSEEAARLCAALLVKGHHTPLERVHTHTPLHTHTHTPLHTHSHTHTHSRTHTHSLCHTHTHTHTHTHSHTHTLTHGVSAGIVEVYLGS